MQMAKSVTLAIFLVAFAIRIGVLIWRNERRDGLVWWLVGWDSLLWLAFFASFLGGIGVAAAHGPRVQLSLIVIGIGVAIGSSLAILRAPALPTTGEVRAALEAENAHLRALLAAGESP